MSEKTTEFQHLFGAVDLSVRKPTVGNASKALVQKCLMKLVKKTWNGWIGENVFRLNDQKKLKWALCELKKSYWRRTYFRGQSCRLFAEVIH